MISNKQITNSKEQIAVMMWAKRRLAVLLIPGLLFQSCNKAASSSGISYQDLEAELATIHPTSPALADFSNSKILQRILAENDRARFETMARQSGMPLVSASGILAIDRDSPRAAFALAMEALANAEHPEDGGWGYVVGFINSKSPPQTSAFVSDFETLASGDFSNSTGLIMLVQTLPSAPLEAWLKSPPQTRKMNTESIVVGTLCGRYQVVPEWLEDKLRDYKDSTGSSLATYAYYATIPQSELPQTLRKVLEDERTEEWQIIAVLRKHKDIIAKEINLETLKAPSSRLILIRRMINPK